MRLTEFWWRYNLRWILGAVAKPKEPERRTGGLTVMGGASVPSNITNILQKGPKFGLEPCVPPHELAALNRRIAEKAPNEDRERCLSEGIDCIAKNVLVHGLSGSTIPQQPKPKSIDQPYLPGFTTCTWTPATSPMSRHSWLNASSSPFWDAPLVAPHVVHVTSTHRLKRQHLHTYAFCGHGGPSANMWLKPFCYFVQCYCF
ncbi:hypothetical protein HPB50_004035 [Hyalomma asiaticum]|uniref:Uncharacterized protein n=1 Tax=Hyalomma asiaticum TaxID=266040 RepID=A0ACB7SVG9_HYAAI|nr:hypothetical protein HPB50_004035 [Hyalomma asiaticum]